MVSGNQSQAQAAATTLQNQTDQVLEADAELADRMQGLELPPETTITLNVDRVPSPPFGSPTHMRMIIDNENSPLHDQSASEDVPEQDHIPDADPSNHLTSEDLIAMTAVYRDMEVYDVDMASVSSSTRSHGWSALSGISSSQVSSIGVIHLPLRDVELRSFHRLVVTEAPGVSGSNLSGAQRNQLYINPERDISWRGHFGIHNLTEYDLTGSASWSTKRLTKELNDIGRDPPSMCSAGPVGDNLVRITGIWVGVALTCR